MHIEDLRTTLDTSESSTSFTKKQLQSLLGKLIFVTAFIKPGRIFRARLLIVFTRAGGQLPTVIPSQWWLDFLPQFNTTDFYMIIVYQ